MFSQAMVSRKGYLIFLGTGSGPSFPRHSKVRLIFLFLLFEKCYNILIEKFVSLTFVVTEELNLICMLPLPVFLI